MNIHSFKSATILIVLLIASGCDFRSATSPSETPSIDIETIAQEIGRQHNQGLDFILDRMKERKEPFASRKEAMDFFRESTVEFIESTSGIESANIKEYVDLDRMMDGEVRDKKWSEADQRFKESLIDLSPEQISHIKKVFAISTQNAQSDYFAHDIKAAIRSANSDIGTSFTPEEVMAIQGVSEIMVSSFSYWKDHRTEWMSEIERLHFSPDSPTSSAPLSVQGVNPCPITLTIAICAAIDWDKVIQADGGGLIDGIVANALVWMITGPPGWLATAAILGGGSAAASTVEVYNQLMELM